MRAPAVVVAAKRVFVILDAQLVGDNLYGTRTAKRAA
jgi:hypothetical protein